MKGIIIKDKGFGASIQDKGRFGYREYGLPSAGVMDEYSYIVANWLVRNTPGEAVIESIFHGLEIEFLSPAVFSITGGEAEVVLGNKRIECWKAVRASKGDRLRIDKLTSGMRNYLAISGGFRIDPVLGSMSTYIPAGLGGYRGRMLEKNDIIPLYPSVLSVLKKRSAPAGSIPSFPDKMVLRVTEGVNFDMFPEKIRNSLLGRDFSVSPQSNRMGIRLEGNDPGVILGKQILSYAVHPGTIQVPPDGKPIIMGSDCQTVGGYPQFANIIQADMYKLGQIRAGTEVKLKLAGKEEASEAREKYYRELEKFSDKSSAVCTDCFEQRP